MKLIAAAEEKEKERMPHIKTAAVVAAINQKDNRMFSEMAFLKTILILCSITISSFAYDWITIDSSIYNYSKVIDLSELNSNIIIQQDHNSIWFKIKADSNISYNAECSRWSLEPMDSFKFETGASYPGNNGCSNVIKKINDDQASLHGMEIIDFIKERQGITLDSLYKLKGIKILFPTDSVILNTPKDINNFIKTGPKLRIFLLNLGEYRDVAYYSLYDGEFTFKIKFELAPCGYDIGEYNGNPDDCKNQYFKNTWKGCLIKEFKISKHDGKLVCTELKKGAHPCADK